MRYKIGDRVKVKSLDWYEKNKDTAGFVRCGKQTFVEDMSKYCGQIVTITKKSKNEYYLNIDDELWSWTDEMIEGLVEEEALKQYEVPTGSIKIWELPNGYIFKDENGNVINATKIVLEKKKKEYPKTFRECCEILDFNVHQYGAPYYRDSNALYYWHLVGLQKLLVCRNAYWKLYGEEMGLGKPWEPDWNTSGPKYVIAYTSRGIEKQWETTYCKCFAFPTEEMRDEFKENFKEEIEICKELLQYGR